MSTKITPTVGRVVWFYPAEGTQTAEFSPPAAGGPLAALVAAVKSHEVVNLTVFDAMGFAHARINVPLVQEGEDAPSDRPYATWMPYQIGQAKKHGNELAPIAEVEQLGADLTRRARANWGGTGLDFGTALLALKDGQRVARAGWNGKGMWLSLSCGETREIPAEAFWSPHNAAHARQQGGTAKVLPSITMKTATGEILMGWLASQTDMLAEDWQIV